MTRVVSIFERLGLGGGGKVKAVFHRMNAFAEMPGLDPVLLNLDHSPNQRLNFAQLQEQGAVAPGVRLMTLPQICHKAAIEAGVQPFSGFPDFDHTTRNGNKRTYLQDGVAVMQDRTKDTSIGPVTKRVVQADAGDRAYTLVNGLLEQMTQRNADGTVETTDYAEALPVRWTKTQGGSFVIGRNLITDTICRMPRIHTQNLFEMIDWGDAVVFFDGVTSAFLSPVTQARRALFLHADHRGPDGHIVPRSKFLIENFKGEAIVTSTHVHKAQIEADVTPAAPLHVIPHFSDGGEHGVAERRHLVTVSRLDLVGKPIDECIKAFCQIEDRYADVDYLIYGYGSGQAELERLIEELGCGGRVRLEGYTSDPTGVFRNALASVYPTTTEGFGLSILEALSNGCPVISYDVNYGPREMIESGTNGELVPRGDIAAIAAAMARVLEQSDTYRAGTGHGLDRYTRAAYLANYRDFVAQLAARGDDGQSAEQKATTA